MDGEEGSALAPIRVSWSSLRRWETCRHKWFRVSEGKSHGAQNARDFLVGNVTDRVMRHWLSISDPEPGQMERLIFPVFNKLTSPNGEKERVIKWKGDPAKDKQKVIDKSYECIRALEPILMEHVIPFEYHPDLWFHAPVFIPAPDDSIIEIEMFGAIDVGVRYPDSSYKLFDLKATENESYIQETLGQGIFYDVAFGTWIGDMTQPTAFGFIAPLIRPEVIWTDITDDDRRVMMSRVIEYAYGIWSGDYSPLVGENPRPCYNCQVRHVCDKWAVGGTSVRGGRASFTEASHIRILSTGGQDGRGDETPAIDGESARA